MFSSTMTFFRAYLAIVASIVLVSSGNCSPLKLDKRATQVSLVSYTYNNNVLAGTVKVQNIAFQKTVQIYWAAGSSFQSTPMVASYASAAATGYENWSFTGQAVGATQFYVKYTVQGSSYYDPGNFVNYQISQSSSTASGRTSTSVSSSTIAATSSTSISSTSNASTSSTSIVSPPTSSAQVPGGAVSPVAIPPFFAIPIPSEAPATVPGKCSNWNGADSCSAFSSGSFNFPDSSENRRWQTPKKSNAQYTSTFQSFSDLVGYADIQYSSARNSAVIVINALSRTGATLSYSVNGVTQSGNTVQVTTANKGGLNIAVSGADGSNLTLDPIYFLWENSAISNTQSTFNNGQKGAIVELFGWPYDDVAKECTFLGKAGYMGVKVFPPQEHVWGSNYYEPDNQFRPWYFLYQPVSYRTQSRMGTRLQLRSMIQTCRAAGVRVYADAVLNHMSGNGNDIQNHQVSGSSCQQYSGHNATNGSPYFTAGNTFQINNNTGTRPAPEYPAVPYGPSDFHCECSLNSWTDGEVMTKCWLSGLVDLNTEKPYVQDRIATYLTDLLSLGFSGMRIDAAKHIGPTSLAQIFGRMKTKLGGGDLPADFLSWAEVILGGEAQLLACSGGPWSWYTNYDTQLAQVGFSPTDISKMKVWSSDYPKEMPSCGSWILPASRFVIQNDDHDQQNPGSSSRDMGDTGSVLIKDKDVAKHRGFEVELFTRTDANWSIKAVLSSYLYMDNGASGFPDGLSDCKLYTGVQPLGACLGVPYSQASVDGSCGYNMVAGQYTRVHRDLSIVNAMRAWVGLGGTTAAALGIAGCS